MRSKSWPLIAVVLLGILTGGCRGSSGQQTFDGQRAYQHVIAQCDLGPRPTGSAAGWATGDYIIAELKELGWVVTSQEFIYKGIKGRNIVGQRGRGPIVILGAHYDTRPYADYNPVDKNQSILGANDGASGVAVLLNWLAAWMKKSQTRSGWSSSMPRTGENWMGGLSQWELSFLPTHWKRPQSMLSSWI